MSDYLNAVETITIDKVTQFGGRVNGKSYNLGKKYTGPQLQEGLTYEVRTSTSPNGAKYINEARAVKSVPLAETIAKQVTKTVATGPTQTIEQPKTEVKIENAPRVNGSSLSPSEKDTRILVQGVLQAVIQSPYIASVADKESFVAEAEDLTRTLVEFIRNFK